MTARFSVLASGSGGNSSFLEVGGAAVLIDIGLGPRLLAARMAAVGASWQQVRAVLLTHTHGDHWKEATLVHLHRRGIPLYCHPDHHARLMYYPGTYRALKAAGLLRDYAEGGPFEPLPGLVCRPFPVPHDSRRTFGFRLEGPGDLFGPGWSLGFASDLGNWTPELAGAVRDVDLLALEFNHDVEMEKNSRRMPHHIARVLGDGGHLSNAQAAEFLSRHLRESAAGTLRHLVQLHLSRDCNLPALAIDAARRVLNRHASTAQIHTAHQDRPLAFIPLGSIHSARAGARRGPRPARAGSTQPALPGLEETGEGGSERPSR
ncbi:MAG TPA: MBL fold metallo-hydrolase [Gemmataceae bacterium]